MLDISPQRKGSWEKKSSGKWRTCGDYSNLNKACPKDAYPLPSIDRLVDEAAGNHVLNFLDSYFGYNQTPMALADMIKIVFIIEDAISVALVQELDGNLQPIYFVNIELQDPETKYQMVEKIALSLVIVVRRLKPYFQNH